MASVMNIAVTGQAERIAELKAKVSSRCNITEFQIKSGIPDCDLVVDLSFDDHPEILNLLLKAGKPLLLSSVKISLAAVVLGVGKETEVPIFGINALPGFIQRELSEVSAFNESDKPVLEKIATKIGLNLKWVRDRVGMVTPRVLFMIINEAYYTVQEGTASKADINTGMKLGTAYPFGPFEFAERIGIKNIYETLFALFTDTGEGRYKICPLLKEEYLRVSR